MRSNDSSRSDPSGLWYLVALSFVSQSVGYFVPATMTAVGLACFLIFISLRLRSQVAFNAANVSRVEIAAAGTVAILIILLVREPWIAVLAAGLFPSYLWARARNHTDRAAALAAFTFGLYLLWSRETASGWYLNMWIADRIADLARVAHLRANLGPSYLGLPLLVPFLTYGVARFGALSRVGFQRTAAWALVVLLAFVIFVPFTDLVAGLSRSTFNLQLSQTRWNLPILPLANYLFPTRLPLLLLGLLLLAGGLAHRLLDRSVEPAAVPATVHFQRRATRWNLVPGALLIALGIGLLAYTPTPQVHTGRVHIYDRSYLNQQTPHFGEYGDKSGGMFVYLRPFLQACGYTVTMGPLDTDTLNQADALIIINLPARLADFERRMVWEFVERGGGLLILGDHTAVGGIREPFNEILEPMQIAFNFDSAKDLREGWPDAFRFAVHPVTQGGFNQTWNEAEIWIGASLTVRPPARPLLWAGHGFSDPGDPANTQRANLGNLQYDWGERLGDIPLIAATHYGQGRVLVYGDTSAYQNGALVSSWQTVQRAMAWLVDRDYRWDGVPIRAAALLLILAGIGALIAARSRWGLAIAMGSVIVGWTAGQKISTWSSGPPTPPNLQIAWIDLTHVPAVSLNVWDENGYGGLVFNLMRNNVFPLVLKELDENLMAKGKMLFVLAPKRPFTAREVRSLKQFSEQGGVLVVTGGWDERATVNPILNSFGMHIGEQPLGKLLVKRTEGDVELFQGWPIHGGDKLKHLVEPWGQSVIVAQSVGKGGVIAIGDPYFFHCKNLEGQQNHSVKNIDFIRQVLYDAQTGVLWR